MPFIDSLPDNAGPPNIFKKYKEVYRPWSEMSEAVMNGPSSLSQGEREMTLTLAAAYAGCDFVANSHTEVACAWGIDRALIDAARAENFDAVSDEKQRALAIFTLKLSRTPEAVTKQDVEAFLAAGWDEDAHHSVVTITARAAFMQRLVHGFGFNPVPGAVAAEHAHKRIRDGYVNMYGFFR